MLASLGPPSSALAGEGGYQGSPCNTHTVLSKKTTVFRYNSI
jgi:hypothetical protein